MKRKIAYGEISYEDIEEWKADKVREIRRENAKEQLKLKYLPFDFDFQKVDEYGKYLAMSDDEQKAFVADMSNDEYEFWNSLETARALYQDPFDRNPGSVTQDKVDAYPERYGYGWNPDDDGR